MFKIATGILIHFIIFLFTTIKKYRYKYVKYKVFFQKYEKSIMIVNIGVCKQKKKEN